MNDNQTPIPQINQTDRSATDLPPQSNTLNIQTINNIPPKKSKIKLILLLVSIILMISAISVIMFINIKARSPQEAKVNKNSPANTASNIVPLRDLPKDLASFYDRFSGYDIKDFDQSHKQITLDTYKQLAGGMNISENFYKDEVNTLIALSIARLASDDTARRSAYRNELYLLTTPYLAKVPVGISDKYFIPATKAQHTKYLNLFQQNRNQALSDKISTLINSEGIGKDTANKLKLSGSLEPYQVIVLDFDSLSDEQKKFAKEYHLYGAVPTMWVSKVGDQTYILVHKNYANDLISDPAGHVRSIISHELIHTQNAFVRGELGRIIEERRAEYFSGDRSSYYDIKQLFIYVGIFSGIDITDMFDSNPTNPTSFYINLYKTLGVEMANGIVANIPTAYQSDTSEAIKNVAHLTGGPDQVIKQAIALGKNDQTSVDKRLANRAELLMKVFRSKDRVISDLQYNLAETYQMPTATKIMTDYINQHY